jgi:hypothetical protein
MDWREANSSVRARKIRNMAKPNPDPDQTDTGKTGVTSLIVTDQATNNSLGNDDTKQHKNELK